MPSSCSNAGNPIGFQIWKNADSARGISKKYLELKIPHNIKCKFQYILHRLAGVLKALLSNELETESDMKSI